MIVGKRNNNMAAVAPVTNKSPDHAMLLASVYEDTLRFGAFILGTALVQRYMQGTFDWPQKGQVLVGAITGTLLYYYVIRPLASRAAAKEKEQQKQRQ